MSLRDVSMLFYSLLTAITSCFDWLMTFFENLGDYRYLEIFLFFFVILTFIRFALVPLIGRGINVADNYSSDLADKHWKEKRLHQFRKNNLSESQKKLE